VPDLKPKYTAAKLKFLRMLRITELGYISGNKHWNKDKICLTSWIICLNFKWIFS